ncbi:hypothetical protein ACI2LC_17595 [Nonomuraea wenchangensis]|uniref:hypothetical protein n=1 Tax=Nonomuraea wenchangensis TaxID=568860 RepID=UPI00384D15CA
MPDATGTAGSPQAPTEPPATPLIPGCTVTLDDTGRFKIQHTATADTLTADTFEHAEICGAILRITAAWAHPLTGDLP